MSLSPGVRLGPYEIIAPLGAGGMGEVYRARDTRLRREVALKILPRHVAADAERRARFEQEAHAAAALNHPNILSVYDVGAADEVSYITSELVKGETVAALIARGRVPVRTLLDIAVQVADGLAAAHAAHIVHRDLKPANVMITDEGRVKILDFGLAKSSHVAVADETVAGHHTVPGMIVGTVSYMSPEQAASKPTDHRSDQFSFGLMLYEMASGRKAFEEPESVQTMAAIISKEPPPLDAQLPAPLRWIIDRCLAKNPVNRYDSTRDLYHELRYVRDHLSEVSRSIEPSSAPPVQRRGRWVLPAAMLVLGAMIPIALVLTQLPPARPDHSTFRYTPFSFEAGGQDSPVFSPDGKAVAYSARQATFAPFQVYVRYLDSPTPLQITNVAASARPIAWSPDSKRVIFATTGAQPAIWSIATVGGEPQQLLVLPPAAIYSLPYAITMSPDNRVIALVTRFDDGMYGVATIDMPGGAVKRYAAEPFAAQMLYNQPSIRFSPDGQRLLLFVNRGVAGEEGWVLPFPEDAAGVRQILPTVMNQPFTPIPAWLPDNRHAVIPIRRNAGERMHLWMLDTMTGERYPLTSGTGNAFSPAVSPDGGAVVFCEFTGDRDVISVDLETGMATVLISTIRNEEMPAWALEEPALVYASDRNAVTELWFRRPGVTDRPVVSSRDFSGTETLLMNPALSPRGERVSFARLETNTMRLWISAVAGGSPIRATSLPNSGTESEVGPRGRPTAPGWRTFFRPTQRRST